MDDKKRLRDISLEEIFSSQGLLASHLSGYEHRPSQLEMARAVRRAIEEGHHLCVEAGTGTGKTLAYLIPALSSEKRVVISTATKNLQEQLFHKDIPFLRRAFLPDLKVSYMKGRQNYLCLKKFYDEKGRLFRSGNRLEQAFEPVGNWLSKTDTGDRSELTWLQDDDPVWSRLDARSESCTGQKCSHFRDCFITRMRQKALESDLIIVNHALFFANLALQADEIGQVLPDFSVLILDEAHEVEAAAASYFGKRVSNFQFEELCRDFERVFSGKFPFPKELQDVRDKSLQFFSRWPGGEGRHSLNFYRRRDGYRIDLRREFSEPFARLQRALRVLYHAVQTASRRPAELDPLERRLEALEENLELIFDGQSAEYVYWFEKRGRGIFLHLTPINIAAILQETLFEKTDCTVLTSATLTTNQNFEYVRSRLGLDQTGELMVPPEFDYEQQAMLYVPPFLPEPRSPQYFLRALREIRKILEITDGHAFLLFTSFEKMHRFHEALRQNCCFPLLRQGDMPKNRLLEAFRETPRSVLCATSSFWQGVDVRGDALRAVVIDKLPFLVPSEPVVAARMDRMRQEGQNPFLEYSLPSAVISLKQGLGRLIRSRKDRGILAVLDSRLRSRYYGRLFLDSLPNCPVTDNMEDLKNFYCQDASLGVKQ